MAYDSKYPDHMLQTTWKEFTAQLKKQLKGNVEAGKGNIIKTRYCVVVVVSIFLFIDLHDDVIRWWHSHRPTDSEVFRGFELLT